MVHRKQGNRASFLLWGGVPLALLLLVFVIIAPKIGLLEQPDMVDPVGREEDDLDVAFVSDTYFKTIELGATTTRTTFTLTATVLRGAAQAFAFEVGDLPPEGGSGFTPPRCDEPTRQCRTTFSVSVEPSTPPGRYSVRVTTIFNEGQTKVLTLTLRVRRAVDADLTIRNFEVLVDGTRVTHSMDACNDGPDGITDPVKVRDSMLPFGAPQVRQDHFVTLPQLAAAHCVHITFFWRGTLGDQYAGSAYIDPEDIFLETNENNNSSGDSNVTVLPVDLVIDRFDYTLNGTTVTYIAEVCNTGAGDITDAFKVGLHYDRPIVAPAVFSIPHDEQTIAQLPSGQCILLFLLRPNAPDGQYISYLYIDWDLHEDNGLIAETNEGNNLAGPLPLTVQSQPDLAVETFTTYNPQYGRASYIVEICNVGTQPSGNFITDVYLHRTEPPVPEPFVPGQQDIQQFVSLAPGACNSKIFAINGVFPGSYHSWVLADSDGTVSESSEANNTADIPEVVVLE